MESVSMKCPYCNHADDAANSLDPDEYTGCICPVCRRVLLLCPHCRQLNQGSAVYCRQCSQRLRSRLHIGGVSSINKYFPSEENISTGRIDLPIVHKWSDRFQYDDSELVDMLFFRDVLVLRNKIAGKIEIRQSFRPENAPWLYDYAPAPDEECQLAVIEDLVVFAERDKTGKLLVKTVDVSALGIAEHPSPAVTLYEVDFGCEGFAVFPFGTADVKDQILCLITPHKYYFWMYSKIIQSRMNGSERVEPSLVVTTEGLESDEVFRAPLVHDRASSLFCTTSKGRVFSLPLSSIRSVLTGMGQHDLVATCSGGLPAGWLASAPAPLDENFAIEAVRREDGARVLATWSPEYDEFRFFDAICTEFEGEFHSLAEKPVLLASALRRPPPYMRNEHAECVVMIGCFELDTRTEETRRYHVVNSSGFRQRFGRLSLSRGRTLEGSEIWTDGSRIGIFSGASSMDIGDILRDGELNVTHSVIPEFVPSDGKSVVSPVRRYARFGASAGLDMVVIHF